MNYVRIHDEGKKCVADSWIIETLFEVPIEEGFSEHFLGSERQHEYNWNFNELFRNDDPLQKRAYEQLKTNVEKIESITHEFVENYMSDEKPKRDLKKGEWLLDAIDGQFGLIYHLYYNQEHHREYEQARGGAGFLTEDMFKSLWKILQSPMVSTMMKNNTNQVYLSVLKKIINDNPKSIWTVIDDMRKTIFAIEMVLGCKVNEATVFENPEIRPPEVKEVKEENFRWITFLDSEEKLQFLYTHFSHMSIIFKHIILKNIDAVMSYEHTGSLIESMGYMKKLFLSCETPFYKQRLIDE